MYLVARRIRGAVVVAEVMLRAPALSLDNLHREAPAASQSP